MTQTAQITHVLLEDRTENALAVFGEIQSNHGQHLSFLVVEMHGLQLQDLSGEHKQQHGLQQCLVRWEPVTLYVLFLDVF